MTPPKSDGTARQWISAGCLHKSTSHLFSPAGTDSRPQDPPGISVVLVAARGFSLYFYCGYSLWIPRFVLSDEPTTTAAAATQPINITHHPEEIDWFLSSRECLSRVAIATSERLPRHPTTACQPQSDVIPELIPWSSFEEGQISVSITVDLDIVALHL